MAMNDTTLALMKLFNYFAEGDTDEIADGSVQVAMGTLGKWLAGDSGSLRATAREAVEFYFTKGSRPKSFRCPHNDDGDEDECHCCLPVSSQRVYLCQGLTGFNRSFWEERAARRDAGKENLALAPGEPPDDDDESSDDDESEDEEEVDEEAPAPYAGTSTQDTAPGDWTSRKAK